MVVLHSWLNAAFRLFKMKLIINPMEKEYTAV